MHQKTSTPNAIKRVVLYFAVLWLVTALLVAIINGLEKAGPYLLLFMVSLAGYLRFSKTTRGYTYTTLVFASFTAAIYYPHFFTGYGSFNYAVLVIPLIQLIMFGMGTAMHFSDFVGIIRSPKGVLIGIVSHFLIMPLLGFTLATIGVKFMGMHNEVAAGIILIGCSPNGMASNVISYLAKANLPLSVTITAISTMLAPFVTPYLMSLLAGAFVKVDAWHMMLDIFKMVIIPIAAGLFIKSFMPATDKLFSKIMPGISTLGILGIILIITAAGRDSLLKVGPLLVLLILIHNICGYLLGYWSARLFRMQERDCRTIAIEVGMQNGGLASGLAKQMGKMATIGLAPVLFSSFMNITGSVLASYWHGKSTGKEEKATTDTL